MIYIWQATCSFGEPAINPLTILLTQGTYDSTYDKVPHLTVIPVCYRWPFCLHT